MHADDITIALRMLDLRAAFDAQLVREIAGVATTGSRNANGAVIRPIADPLTVADRVPLMWHHNAYRPLGLVTRTWRDGDKLRFQARLATGFEWSDDVWREIKAARVLGVSVGALNLCDDHDDLTDWALGELSICNAGANRDARIQRVREITNALNILPHAPNPRREITWWDTTRRIAA